MQESLFVAWLATNFPAITVAVVAKLNDTKNPLTYLHRRLLREEYSVSGKWDAINTYNTQVMADVVAMDSSLPLKRRDSISKASGDIPKMGMEMTLNERQLSDLDVLVAQKATTEEILVKLFADVPKVIGGIYERMEEMFLQGLSTGVTLIDDPENVGTGVRIDFGYLTANKFGVGVLWSNKTTAKPFDDLKKLTDRAAELGYVITTFSLDGATFNALAGTDQAKQLFAFAQNFVGGNIPAPSLKQINQFAQDRYGFTFEIINRTMRYERNGAQTVVRPWAAGMIVGRTSDQVGILSYAKLAEQNRPTAGVSYQTVENKILVSKFSTNRPSYKEFTTSQARVIPVITNVDQLFQLDTTTLQV